MKMLQMKVIQKTKNLRKMNHKIDFKTIDKNTE